jgi:hypothetical protein
MILINSHELISSTMWGHVVLKKKTWRPTAFTTNSKLTIQALNKYLWQENYKIIMLTLSIMLGKYLSYECFKMKLTYPQASIGVEQCGTRICHAPCRWLIIYLQPRMSFAAVCYQGVPSAITYKNLEQKSWITSEEDTTWKRINKKLK